MSDKWTEYWSWKDNEGNYHFIYPHIKLVEMCSPDYFEGATARGEGRIVKVQITEVEEG